MRVVVFSPYFNRGQNPRRYRLDALQKALSGQPSIAVTSMCGERKMSVHGDWIRRKSTWKKMAKTIIKPDPFLFHSLYYLFKYLLLFRNRRDIILTVSPPFSMHWAGLVLKRVFGHTWYADVGDVANADQYSLNGLSITEEKTITHCDKLIVNSDYMARHYGRFWTNDKPVVVIENGIRIDPAKIVHTLARRTALGYIGNTYDGLRSGMREAGILKKLLQRREDFILRFYGTQCEELVRYFQQSEVAARVRFYLAKDATDLEEAYSGLRCLILLSNGRYPNIPSKTKEYLASKKPIIYFTETPADTLKSFMSQEKGVMEVPIDEANIDEMIRFIESHSDPVIRDCAESHGEAWRKLFQ